MANKDNPKDDNCLSGIKKTNDIGSGNGFHINSLITHYSAFSETTKENSATIAKGIGQPLPTPSYPYSVSLFSDITLSHAEIIQTTEEDVATISNNITYRDHSIAVVIPAYNEQLLIGETLISIPTFVSKIYVVDDCSKDNTWEKILDQANKDSRIVPLHHEINKGAGAAIVTGYLKALHDGIQIVATMDGDNQMDPTFLNLLLDPIIDNNCDFSMGNRLIIPENRKGMSKWRYFGNSVLTFLTKIASGYWSMMDPQNGYTAISRKALETIGIKSLYPRYGYLNDRLVKLNVYGFRVKGVPHPARYRNEISGIRYRSYIIKVSYLLLKDFLWRLKIKYMVMSFHPLVFFYFFGALFSFTGVICGFYSLYYKFILDNPIFVPAITSLVLFGIGLQSLFFAMFFDMDQEQRNLRYN